MKRACWQVRLQANTEQCGLSTDYARMNMRRSGATSCEMYHPGAAAEFLSSKTCYNVHGVRAPTPRMEVWSERRSTNTVDIRRRLAHALLIRLLILLQASLCAAFVLCRRPATRVAFLCQGRISVGRVPAAPVGAAGGVALSFALALQGGCDPTCCIGDSQLVGVPDRQGMKLERSFVGWQTFSYRG